MTLKKYLHYTFIHKIFLSFSPWKYDKSEYDRGHEPFDEYDEVNVDVVRDPVRHGLGVVDYLLLPLHLPSVCHKGKPNQWMT